MTDLRVAAFNVRTGLAFDGCRSWPLRRAEVGHVIESLEADVVGLQEVHAFQLRWLRARLPDYEAIWTGRGRRRRRRGEGCPVLVRRTFGLIVDHATVWFGEGPQRPGLRLDGATAPRIVTTCRIQLASTGAVIQVSSTHLDQRSEERRCRSVDQLVNALDRSVPQVVLGDLNAGPDSEVLHRLHRAGLRSALPADAGGTMHAFTGRLDGRRLDHILVDDRFQVLAGEVRTQPVGQRLASDHWPVVADLRLPPAG